MKIHSDKLTTQDIRDAAIAASGGGYRDVLIEKLDTAGSRSRARAFDFALSGAGTFRAGYAAADFKSATWDQWGVFLAYLFNVDPAASVNGVYEGADMFHWATGDRFRTLAPRDQHQRHRWTYKGKSCTGSYYVQECDCGAVSRRMAHGHKFHTSIAQEFDGVI